MNKYIKNVFYENSKPTIGVDFANKPISKDDLKSRSTSCDDGAKINTYSSYNGGNNEADILL